MTTLIAANDTWLLWALICTLATIAIYLEQNYKWAGQLSGPIICILSAVVLANLGVVPDWTDAYGVVWNYCIPISVVMFLFKANLKKILGSTGKMFLCFNISAIGTILGSVLAFLLLKGVLEHSDIVMAMSIGGAIGGSVNELAVANSLALPENMMIAYTVAVNVVTVPVFITHAWLPGNKFFRKHFTHPHEDKLALQSASSEDAKTRAAAFWGGKEISLLDIAKTIATAVVIAGVSTKIADFLGAALAAPEGAGVFASLPSMILGNQFVILTVVTMTLVSIFPNYFENLAGAQEIGTYLIYMFFVVIGCSGNLRGLVENAALLIAFALICNYVNIIFSVVCGKLLKQDIEDVVLGSNATIGGPSTAAALAVAKGYNDLVTPSILCGLWGYIIGTPLAITFFTLLQSMA